MWTLRCPIAARATYGSPVPCIAQVVTPGSWTPVFRAPRTWRCHDRATASELSRPGYARARGRILVRKYGRAASSNITKLMWLDRYGAGTCMFDGTRSTRSWKRQRGRNSACASEFVVASPSERAHTNTHGHKAARPVPISTTLIAETDRSLIGALLALCPRPDCGSNEYEQSLFCSVHGKKIQFLGFCFRHPVDWLLDDCVAAFCPAIATKYTKRNALCSLSLSLSLCPDIIVATLAV
jgi:hypothetical protein